MCLGMVIHASNPHPWEAEAGRSQVQGQFGLHGETVQKWNETKQKK
jgi:hypothetical protein